MVLHIHTTRCTLRLADRPVLLERAGAVDTRLVGARGDEHVVVAAVGVGGSFALGTAAGVVCAEGFDNVVLDERIAGPAVDGEVPVSLGLEGAAVVDSTKN